MPCEVNTRGIDIKLLTYDPQNVEDIFFTQLPKVFRIAGTPSEKSAIAFTPATIPPSLIVTEGRNNDIAPFLCLRGDALIAYHLLGITPKPVQQDQQGRRFSLLIAGRDIERVFDILTSLLERVASFLDFTQVLLTGKQPCETG